MLYVKSGKPCTMVGEDTVDDYIENFDGSSGGCNIPWGNNPVSTNGDSSSVGVIFGGGTSHTTIL